MKKRILIFGGTGRTGQLAIEYAGQKGYAVTTLVRNPDKLSSDSEKLSVIQGSLLQLDDVRNAMKGCDYVISLLSALSEKESFSFKRIDPPHILEKSIGNTIKAMKELGVGRILYLSSIGVGDSHQYAPWYMRLMIKILNFKLVFADHNKAEELIKKSGLDWTIARPVGLNNNEAVGNLQITYNQTPKPFKMSRKQLAMFFIDNLDNKEYIHKTPILSEK